MTKKRKTPPDDAFEIRCPKLGHQIFFSYCRKENFGSPCFKTLDCWYYYFDVEKFLRDQLTEEEWINSFEKIRTPKIVSLLELIDKAKQENK